MKKLSVLAFIALASLTACAQKVKESQVPAVVKATFQKQYPNTKGSWEKEKGNYEVNFKAGGKSTSALIAANGTLIETETDIAVKELPQAIHDYLKVNYKNEKIKEAAIIIKANGEKIYEAEVKGKDLLFDAKGNFLKEVKA